MNPQLHRRTLAPVAAPATACRAAEIGRGIARVERGLSAIEAARAAMAEAERPIKDQAEAEFYDELKALDLALEFASVTSLEGVAVVVAQLGLVAEESLEGASEPWEREVFRRRIVRLHRAALDALLQLGELDAVQIGVSMKRPPERRTSN